MGPRGEAQKAQKEVLDNIKEAKEFDCIRQDKQKEDNARQTKNKVIKNW